MKYLCAETMKTLPNIIFIGIAIMIVACSHGTHQQQLVQVDSLLSRLQRDSAYRAFKQIDRDELNNDDGMYYDVLKVDLSQSAVPADSFHFEIPRDSLLMQCLKYYDSQHDSRMQLYCYLYLGKIYTALNLFLLTFRFSD